MRYYRTLGKVLLVYSGVVVLVAFSCFPLVWMVLTSLKPLNEIFIYPPEFIPKHIVLSNYGHLFSRTHFLRQFRNSVCVAGYTIFFCILLGSLGAYSLTRYKYRGRALIAGLVLTSYMFAPIMLIIPLYMMLKKFHLINTHIGLVTAYMSIGLPFSVWLLRSFFLGIPIEIEEAAWIDGAGRIRAIFYIILPNALPGIIATGIFVFIIVWNDYLFARTIIASISLVTFSVGIADMARSVACDWGMVLSAGTSTTVPALIIFIAAQKYVISGWGAGAIK